MSVKTTPDQHQSNLRNVYGTFAIEGMTISKDTRRNLDRIGSGQSSYQQVVNAKLYENVSKGLLPEKRFQMLADRYDKEQAELTEKIEQYEREGRAEHDQLDKIQDFIDEVSKYAGITELNYKILHQLIDKILVSKAEKVDGEYVQKIQIFYRFIGPLDAIE